MWMSPSRRWLPDALTPTIIDGRETGTIAYIVPDSVSGIFEMNADFFTEHLKVSAWESPTKSCVQSCK